METSAQQQERPIALSDCVNYWPLTKLYGLFHPVTPVLWEQSDLHTFNKDLITWSLAKLADWRGLRLCSSRSVTNHVRTGVWWKGIIIICFSPECATSWWHLFSQKFVIFYSLFFCSFFHLGLNNITASIITFSLKGWCLTVYVNCHICYPFIWWKGSSFYIKNKQRSLFKQFDAFS